MLYADRLLVECDGQDIDFLAALDVKSGVIRWKTDRTTAELTRKFAFSTPLPIQVEGKTQIVCPSAGHVAAFDPQTGREIWRVDYGDGYSVIPRPVFGHGLVYVCTGWNIPVLLAINPTGRGDVTKTHVAWQMQSGVPNTPSLLLVGDELYMISDRGIANCVNAVDGRSVWQQRIGGNFSASPIYADGKVYLQSEEGEGIVFKPGKTYEELARNQLPPRTFASYAVADSALFIRSESQLFRIEETSGRSNETTLGN
jgi:outer membrane protein assembly factor BamB